MAKVSNEFPGLLSGRVGNIIYKIRNGKNYLSKLPKKKKRKPNEGELNAREKFSFINKFLKPLAPLLKWTFLESAIGMTSFNKAISLNYAELVQDVFPNWKINFAQLILSQGDFPKAQFSLVASFTKSTLAFIWNDGLHRIKPGLLFVAVYCEEMNHWTFDEFATPREDGIFFLEVPHLSGKPIHTYLGFISEDLSVSDSQYTGMVNVL